MANGINPYALQQSTAAGPYSFGGPMNPANMPPAPTPEITVSGRQGLGGRMMGILGSIGDFIGNNPELMNRLAIGFQGMTLNPNQALINANQRQLELAQAQRIAQGQAGRTAEWLATQPGGEAYANLLRTNPTLKASDVLGMYSADARRMGQFEMITGEQLNQQYGGEYPEGQLFKLNKATGEITSVQGFPSQTAPSNVREYEYAKSEDNYKGTFAEFLQQTKTDRPLTTGENIAAGFADRIAESNRLFESPITVDGQTMNLEMAGTFLKDYSLSQLPLGGMERFMVSEDYLKYDQAKRNFINATLRRESGAAIADSEFENANIQYFPLPGDTDEVVAQKRRNREQIQNSLAREAGRVYERAGVEAPSVQEQTESPAIKMITASRDGTRVAVTQNGVVTFWNFNTEEQAEEYTRQVQQMSGAQ